MTKNPTKEEQKTEEKQKQKEGKKMKNPNEEEKKETASRTLRARALEDKRGLEKLFIYEEAFEVIILVKLYRKIFLCEENLWSDQIGRWVYLWPVNYYKTLLH